VEEVTVPIALALLVLGGIAAWYIATHAPVMDFSNPGTDDTDGSGGATPLQVDTRTTGDFGHAWQPSPNRSSRNGEKVTTLIWHYTAGPTLAGAVQWLCTPSAKASAHFVIGRDGKTVQLVPCADSAWHAGDGTIHNASSIGIEVVNVGYVTPDDDAGWLDTMGNRWVPDGVAPVERTLRYPSGLAVTRLWVPYTDAQVSAMRELLAKLAASPWAPCLRDQRGHEDVALPEGHKTDPGPLFPWSQLVPTLADRQRRRTTVV
jgi:N-acetylmuramoyl-L-alanine amidase